MIREAEGEAEAILKVQQARAEGIKFLKEADPTIREVLQLRSMEHSRRRQTAKLLR